MIANRQQGVGRVAVFGAGVVALFAAIAIARTSPRTQVMLIRTRFEDGALADRLPATLPINGPLLERLGLAEDALIASGAAVHRLGERFGGWGERVRDWAQGFGAAVSLGLAGAPHQLWLGTKSEAALSALYPASVLVAAGRYGYPAGSGSMLDTVEPGLRFDPGRLRPILAEMAARAGVSAWEATAGPVERAADGACAGVVVGLGRRVTADLYIDATGPDGLLAAVTGTPWVEWGGSLPVDRLLIRDRPAAPDLADDYTAHDLGWRAAWSQGDRTIEGLGFRSAEEARARRTAGPEAVLIPLRCGRLQQPWTGNVLAIGDAAVAAGPLGTAGLALALLQIELLLELWPGRIADPLLIAEYNRRAGLRADRMHDWLAAPYMVASRHKGGLWQAMRGAAMPEGLARTVEQFAQRGSVPHHEEESFSRDDWAQRLIGLGIRPQQGDPIAGSADPVALAAALARAAAATAKLRSLPAYADYLAAVRGRQPG